ncbi:MAG: hypothetical protein WKG07_12990 [Hymenobacter sp.]
MVVDEERAKLRLSHGAKPSDTAEALLEQAGVLERDKDDDPPSGAPEAQEQPEEATPPPATRTWLPRQTMVML